MAVWLSLNLSQGTPNETARTNTVTATVTVHYSGGSYNGNSPSGTLTIDGQSFSFTCNFNYAGIGQGAASTGTGSVTAASRTVTVSYGSSSTKTVYASASFASGTGSGTVSASDSISLTPISSSGGSSGGGDSGEEWEEGGSGTGSESGGSTIEIPLNIEVHFPYGTNFLPWAGPRSIRFTTPDFSGSSEYVAIVFVCDSGYIFYDEPVNIALCSSDANLAMYRNNELILDKFQLESTSAALTTGEDIVVDKIATTKLKGNTDYYLIVWGYTKALSLTTILMGLTYTSGGSGDDSGGDDSNTTTSRGAFYISNNSEPVEYEGFIKKGDSWEKLAVGGTAFQRVEGEFTTNNYGVVSFVDVGFTPDIVLILSPGYEDNGATYYEPAVAVFSETPVNSLTEANFWFYDDNNVEHDALLWLTSAENGFTVSESYYETNDIWNPLSGKTLNYIAIKYT